MNASADNVVSPAIAEVNSLVEKGLRALDEFLKLDQEQIDFIVAKASIAALDKHGVLAMHAVEETGRGVFEDKATKNLFACENVVRRLRDLKTVGVISENDVTGITEIADPVGVVCGIVPTTNPTSTTIFKSLIALKTRNPIIFSFHPSAQQCSAHAARIVRDAAIAAGAPESCIQWIEKPSMEGTSALMKHPGVATILATGGNAMVEAAYSCGKPALGVGAGNVPAYVEKTADIKQVAHDIVMSKSFDNGMVCASEQAVIADKEIYKELAEEFKSYGVYFANKKEKAMLEDFIFGVTANCANCGGAKLNSAVVGKPAAWIAEQAGFKVPEKTNIIIAECREVGPNEPLTREKLSPVLAMIKADSTEQGLKFAEEMVAFDGLGHSAAIHTADEELVKTFGSRVKALRVIWNSPSTFGGIGDVYNAFLPSLTLGCGSYGKNAVGGNVSAVNLLNIKKVGRRRNNMQWFKVPAKIYFERDSIQYLQDMKDCEKVMIVTDRSMVDLGFVDKVTHQLHQRKNKVTIQLFTDVEADPSVQTVYKGTDLMRSFQPDTIIALGGGSPMDAAKAMWLFYEQPQVDFEDLVQKFMDIRKRAFRFPELGRKAKFIGIPTTSGTGSEVTPFTVISDGDKKIPHRRLLADPDHRHRRSRVYHDRSRRRNCRHRSGRTDPRRRSIRFRARQRLYRRPRPASHQARVPIPRTLLQTRRVRPRSTRTHAQRLHHRRHGVCQCVLGHQPLDGAQNRRQIPRSARPRQRHPAAARHPLQRHAPAENRHLAEVQLLQSRPEISGNRPYLRPAMQHTGRRCRILRPRLL